MKFRLWINFCVAIGTSIIMAIFIILFLLSYDSSFKNLVELQVKRIFCQAFKSHLKGTVKRVNVLTGEIELENVLVTSYVQDDIWSWQAERFTIQFSWLSYIVRGKFDISVNLDCLWAHSQVINSHIVIIDHLQSFIAGAEGFPATFKALTIAKGNFKLIDNERKLVYSTRFNGSYGAINSTLYVHLAVEQGDLFLDKQKIFDALTGSIHLSLSNFKQPSIDAMVDGTLHLSNITSGKNLCYIDGQWHKDRGQFFLHTSDTKYAFSLYNWIKNSGGVSGDMRCTIPLEYVSTLIPAVRPLSLEGECNCQLHIVMDEAIALEGEVQGKNIRVCSRDLGNLDIVGSYKKNVWKWIGKLFHSDHFVEDIHAELSYNDTLKEGSAAIEMVHALSLWPPLGLDLLNGFVHVDFKDSLITSSYHCSCRQLGIKDPWAIEGTAHYANSLAAFQGGCAAKKFDIAVATEPSCALSHCTIYEKKEKPLLDIKQRGENIQGIIDVQLLKDIGTYFFHYKIPGQGLFEITTERDDATVKMHLVLKEGNIRVPCTYTIVRAITATCIFDYLNKMIVITDGVIRLDKGQLECKRAVMRFDEAGFIQSVVVPITLKKAFLTLQKEVFAVISGFITMTSLIDQEPLVHGSLVIDRSYCKKNIFSQLSDGQSVGLPFINGIFLPEQKDLRVDLTIETKKPVEVKTSFLETQVQIDAALHGSVQNPELSGSINLVQGTLAFPYRPLSITHGMVYFLPHQLYDPTLELIAKGKIRKYQITLRCNGSLQHPTINFESTPPLTEEQIITLLLAGTEEGSLSLAMPALIMQRLQNVIFGPEQSALKLEGYFKSLLEPLKHIRFIPGFSDQSGRGGFRGSIEIDVNDQLRAMIQKNFSLSEDIKFEVEYFFSDDITFRGIRDERADFGGEVEMRWKF